MNNLSLRLKFFLVVLIAIIAIGTIGFITTVGLSVTDAFYFSIVTVATVGYGDISPSTAAGKILSIFLIITGVGTFLGVVANATDMLLNRQEQKKRMEKLNMVIGVFYTEAGRELLTFFVENDPKVEQIAKDLVITGDWKNQQFLDVKKKLKKHEFSVNEHTIDLGALRYLLIEKGNLFLRLLENPSILEHESFTDLLRALLHLKEELLYRGDFSTLPITDVHHLSGDIKRAYTLLTDQ